MKVHHGVSFLDGFFTQILGEEHPGIVDEDVDAEVALVAPVQKVLGCLILGKVHENGQDVQLFCRLFQLLLPVAHNDHLAAALRQLPCILQPYPRAPPGHQSRQVFLLTHTLQR